MTAAPTPVHTPSPSPSPSASAIAQICAEPGRARAVFQPVLDLKRGVVVGYEALARFDGAVDASPEQWFVAAGEHGLEGDLEAVMVRAALAARPGLPRNCFLALNVSPRALLTSPVQDALRAAPRLDAVVLEITEQVAVDDFGELGRALAPSREAGALVAVDDTGARHASLREIVELRPEFVKLDRSLVCDVDRDEAKTALIESLGAFASRVDAWVVAEGVERLEELDALIRLNVPLAQGFALGRPKRFMSATSAVLEAHVQARVSGATRPGRSIRELLERAPAVPDHVDENSIAALFAGDAALSEVVLVDGRGRPVGLVDRTGAGARRPPLAPRPRVEPDACPVEVAQRAMTRPPEERFRPVLCCDGRGRYVGVVRVERLVEALAAREPNAPS